MSSCCRGWWRHAGTCNNSWPGSMRGDPVTSSAKETDSRLLLRHCTQPQQRPRTATPGLHHTHAGHLWSACARVPPSHCSEGGRQWWARAWCTAQPRAGRGPHITSEVCPCLSLQWPGTQIRATQLAIKPSGIHVAQRYPPGWPVNGSQKVHVSFWRSRKRPTCTWEIGVDWSCWLLVVTFPHLTALFSDAGMEPHPLVEESVGCPCCVF